LLADEPGKKVDYSAVFERHLSGAAAEGKET
jgi:hypothetical protein